MRVYVDAQRRKARRLVDAELFSSVTQVEHTCPWGEARTEVFNDPLDKDVLASRRERYMSAVRELYRNPLHSSLSSVDLAKRPDSLPVGGKTSAPLWRTIASEQLQRRPFYLVDGLGTVRRPRRVVRVLDHQARIDELVDGAAAHGFPSVWRVALSVVIREGPPVLVGSFREPTPGRFSLHGEPTRGRAGGPGYLWSAGPASLRKPTPPELRVAPSRGIEGSEDRLRSPAYDH